VQPNLFHCLERNEEEVDVDPGSVTVFARKCDSICQVSEKYENINSSEDFLFLYTWQPNGSQRTRDEEQVQTFSRHSVHKVPFLF
jgi:hypothetical protein